MSFLTSVLIFSGHIPRRGIAGSHSSLFFNLRTLHTVSIRTAPIYIPTKGILGFAFLHILANICCLCLSDYTHLNRCEMISHCGFAGISLIINLHSHVQISIIHNSKDVETWKQDRYQWESKSLSVQFSCSVVSNSL